MGHACEFSGVSRQHGHRVSHANNKRKHIFRANLQTRRIYVPEEGRFIRVKISTRVIRTIDKIGLAGTLKKYNISLKELLA